MLEPPTFAFKRKDVKQSQYYERAFNWLHVKADDGDGEPDMMCGFAASDSSDNNGRLYGAEYSIHDDASADINPEVLGIGDLVQEAESGAFVWWTAPEPHEWADSIVMIGDPTSAAQLIYGENQGGGGAFALPQASSKDFQPAYAGTYAAMLYQYDKGAAPGDEESVETHTIVITAGGGVQVFNFGENTSTGTPLFSDTAMTPVADYYSESLVNDLNTYSLLNDALDHANFPGIRNAYLCHGAFIAEGSIDENPATAVIIFDPEGGFAGFHIYDCYESGDGSDDILGFGLAIKDTNFVNPD